MVLSSLSFIFNLYVAILTNLSHEATWSNLMSVTSWKKILIWNRPFGLAFVVVNLVVFKLEKIRWNYFILLHCFCYRKFALLLKFWKDMKQSYLPHFSDSNLSRICVER